MIPAPVVIMLVLASITHRFSIEKCMTGPGGSPVCWAVNDGKPVSPGQSVKLAPVGMTQWDVDRDGDIDLRDWAIRDPLIYRMCGCMSEEFPYIFVNGVFVNVRTCVDRD